MRAVEGMDTFTLMDARERDPEAGFHPGTLRKLRERGYIEVTNGRTRNARSKGCVWRIRRGAGAVRCPSPPTA
jgi:hypothetical protein